MDTDQPRLEISEDEMDDGQELLGYFGIATFGSWARSVFAPVAVPPAGPPQAIPATFSSSVNCLTPAWP
jgi:hypothetical protein